MRIKIKEINSFTREMAVSVPWKDLQDKFQTEFNEFRAQYSQKGFRRGKVPVPIIKKSYGPAIEMDFADKAVSEFYTAALTKKELDPINRAQISELSFHEGEDLDFTAVFEVEPPVELPEYKNKIKIDVVRLTHTETDINSALAEQQQRHSTFESVDKKIEDGHFVKGSFQELDADGNPVAGKEPDSKYFVIGSSAFSGETGKLFIGAGKGDVIRVTPAVEENPVTFDVTIEDVEEQTLPELDDELAKKIDPEIETMDELKAKLADVMTKQLEKEYKLSVQGKLTEFFVKNAQVDVPTSWKENYLNHTVEDMKKQAQPGQPFNEAETRKAYSETADNNLKWHLIRGKLLEVEGMTVSKEDVKARIEDLVAENEASAAQIRSHYKQPNHKEDLKEDIANEILFERLKEFAVIKDITKTTDEFREESHNHDHDHDHE